MPCIALHAPSSENALFSASLYQYTGSRLGDQSHSQRRPPHQRPTDTLMRPLAWFLALALPRTPTATFEPAFSDKADLVTALRAWCSNPASAEAVHGPISAWNTSRVTDMSQLSQSMSCFATFNEAIGAWDVSQVTNMKVCRLPVPGAGGVSLTPLLSRAGHVPVSYTHLTLPTICSV